MSSWEKTKIPGWVITVGDLCFQLKNPLLDWSQRNAKTKVVPIGIRVEAVPVR